MEEIWKDIYFIENGIEYDYRGLYQVSNTGKIKSLNYNHTGKEKILKNLKDTSGYEQVQLYKKHKKRKLFIHRIVAHIFLFETYFDGAEINHKDENKENNCMENLEWCTREYNMNYGTRIKRVSESNKTRLIDRFDKYGNYIDTKYKCEYVEMGFDDRNIWSCCVGKRKTTGGYIFKYHIEDTE